MSWHVPRMSCSSAYFRFILKACPPESSVSQTCKDQVPSWLLFGSGGQGQVRSCEDTPRSSSCVAQMRLYKLCGDFAFTSGYYQEECLIRARK